MARDDDRPTQSGRLVERPGRAWTFFTNHTHALVCVALNPDITQREIAEEIGITSRAVHTILLDLVLVEAISRYRHGRGYRYLLHGDCLVPGISNGTTVRDLLSALLTADQLDAAPWAGTQALGHSDA